MRQNGLAEANYNRGILLAAILLLCSHSLKSQSPSERDTGPSSATRLPLSGTAIPPASVSVTQRTTNVGGGGSVNIIYSSVAVQSPFSGSTPSGTLTPGQISLSLQQALDRGFRFNLGAISQSHTVLDAEGARRIARSTLLPTLNTVISEQLERLNLRTRGVESTNFPVTAQFNFFDARAARLNQTMFDLVRVRNLHSATENLRANLKSARNARDLIVLAVAGGYLQLIATRARVMAATAQVETARAIDRQAADRLSAGLIPRVDSMRARVQMQTEEQRLRSLQADWETQKLRFARIIGLPLGQQFTIADD
jgi:outer membrane protein TolC